MAIPSMLTVLLLSAVAFASQDFPSPGELTRNTPGWPCPIQTQIAPCICSQDTEYNLHIECSMANSEEQLERIFSSTFPFTDFYELKIIHNKDDVNNVIDVITPNTFADLSFQRIIITGTRLEDIADEAFADSHGTLEYLDLSNNYLKTFTFESLPRYAKLNTFIIDDNFFPVLQNLESETLEVFSANRNHNMEVTSHKQFDGAPSLRELYLSEIGLATLRTGTFNNLTQLQVVDFSWNHLTELEEDSIRVKGATLQHVSFDGNNITFIRHDSLWGFAPNATLTMASNKLVFLEKESWEHVFLQITDRETIDLRGNRLLCGCDIDWLFMEEGKDYLCRLTDTTLCYNSQQIIFFDVNIICDQCSASFFDCPEQPDCKNPVPPLF